MGRQPLGRGDTHIHLPCPYPTTQLALPRVPMPPGTHARAALAATEAELQSTIKEKEDDLSEMAAKFRDNAEREGKSA